MLHYLVKAQNMWKLWCWFSNEVTLTVVTKGTCTNLPWCRCRTERKVCCISKLSEIPGITTSRIIHRMAEKITPESCTIACILPIHPITCPLSLMVCLLCLPPTAYSTMRKNFDSKLTTSRDGSVKSTETLQEWKYRKTTLLWKTYGKERLEDYICCIDRNKESMKTQEDYPTTEKSLERKTRKLLYTCCMVRQQM